MVSRYQPKRGYYEIPLYMSRYAAPPLLEAIEKRLGLEDGVLQQGLPGARTGLLHLQHALDIGIISYKPHAVRTKKFPKLNHHARFRLQTYQCVLDQVMERLRVAKSQQQIGSSRLCPGEINLRKLLLGQIHSRLRVPRHLAVFVEPIWNASVLLGECISARDPQYMSDALFCHNGMFSCAGLDQHNARRLGCEYNRYEAALYRSLAGGQHGS